MAPSFRHQVLRPLAMLFAAVPFAFGLIRAFETEGRDLRYLWVALAASCGAAALMWAARYWSRPTPVLLSAGVFVMATLFATGAALILGTRLGPGILVVASGFGFCLSAATLFHSVRA